MTEGNQVYDETLVDDPVVERLVSSRTEKAEEGHQAPMLPSGEHYCIRPGEGTTPL